MILRSRDHPLLCTRLGNHHVPLREVEEGIYRDQVGNCLTFELAGWARRDEVRDRTWLLASKYDNDNFVN